MPMYENLKEFTERQACDRLYVDGEYVFANGATSTGEIHRDPPTDPAQLLDVQLRYAQTMFKNCEKRINECHAYIKTQAEYHAKGVGPLPHPDAFNDLKRFKAQRSKWRIQVTVLQKQLVALRGPSYAERYNERRAVEFQAARDAMAQLRAIINDNDEALTKGDSDL